MHLYALLLLTPANFGFEGANIEIRAELPIHACEKIAIERRCDSRRIVVSLEHHRDGLDQIRADQQTVVGTHRRAHILQEIQRAWLIKVADRAPEEEQEHAPVRLPLEKHPLQAFDVR